MLLETFSTADILTLWGKSAAGVYFVNYVSAADPQSFDSE